MTDAFDIQYKFQTYDTEIIDGNSRTETTHEFVVKYGPATIVIIFNLNIEECKNIAARFIYDYESTGNAIAIFPQFSDKDVRVDESGINIEPSNVIIAIRESNIAFFNTCLGPRGQSCMQEVDFPKDIAIESVMQFMRSLRGEAIENNHADI